MIVDSSIDDISIHALRGEGDCEAFAVFGDFVAISIHALRGEGDLDVAAAATRTEEFQSTPSVGRATAKMYKHTLKVPDTLVHTL